MHPTDRPSRASNKLLISKNKNNKKFQIKKNNNSLKMRFLPSKKKRMCNTE